MARRVRGLHRGVPRVLAAAALALGLGCGPSWVSVSASASTPEPSASAPTEPEPSEPSPSAGFTPSDSLQDPPCETSAGVYPFPLSGSGDSSSSQPSWVPSSGTHTCVQIVDSLVLDVPTPPEPAPLSVTGIDSLTNEVQGLRELVLWASGLTICCVAGLLFRTRSK